MRTPRDGSALDRLDGSQYGDPEDHRPPHVAPPDEDDDADLLDPDEEVVATAGATSHVYLDDEVVGHVLLLDLDDSTLLDAVRVADDLDGVAAVVESSEGSHHVWCLDVRDLREQSVRALSYYAADDAHVGSSWRRGYSVLRVVSKVRRDGESYKDAPVVRHVSPSGAAGDHSAAHAAWLRSRVEEQAQDVSGSPEALDPAHAPESVRYGGNERNLRLDRYETLTDRGKAALSED